MEAKPQRRGRPPKTERNQAIYKAWKQGLMTAQELADQYGITRTSVFNALRQVRQARGGFQSPARARRHQARDRKIAAARAAGASYKELAARHGLTDKRIWQICDRLARQAAMEQGGLPGRVRKTRYAQELVERNRAIFRAWAQGDSPAALAAKHGITRQRLYLIIEKERKLDPTRPVVEGPRGKGRRPCLHCGWRMGARAKTCPECKEPVAGGAV